jgi:hypothetical protein
MIDAFALSGRFLLAAFPAYQSVDSPIDYIPPFYRIFASMKKILTLHILLALAALPSRAQKHEIYCQRIATLQVVAGTDWQALPITLLNGQPIHIDFDDMTHDYHRYTYRIEHCDVVNEYRRDKYQ